MVVLSRWQLGLGILGAVGLTATLILTAWSTRAAVQAARLNREAYIAEQRPWLSITPTIIGDFRVHKTLILAEVCIEVKNIGKSPAENVFVYTNAMPSFGNHDWAEDHAARTILFREGMFSTHDLEALLPGEDISITRKIEIRIDFEKSPLSHEGKRYVILNLLVGVAYDFEFSKMQPITARAYRLLVAGTKPPQAIFPEYDRINEGVLIFEPCRGTFIR